MELSRPELEDKINLLGPWYHDIDLGNGIRTGTDNPHTYKPDVRWNVIGAYLAE
jgi:hypothetical protein